MNRFKEFLSWLSRQSVARIFSYTRHIEGELAYWKQAHANLTDAANKRERELQNMREEDRLAWDLERRRLFDQVAIKYGMNPPNSPYKESETPEQTKTEEYVSPRKANIVRHMKKELEQISRITSVK